MQSIYYLGLLGIRLTLFEQIHFSPLMRDPIVSCLFTLPMNGVESRNPYPGKVKYHLAMNTDGVHFFISKDFKKHYNSRFIHQKLQQMQDMVEEQICRMAMKYGLEKNKMSK